jgi:hypothetical protein
METESSIKHHLQCLEEQLLQSDTRKSADCVSALLSDDFVEFGSSGSVFNKQDAIEGLQGEGEIRLTLSEFRALQLAPELVLVTYRAARQDEACESQVYSLRSSIWKFTDGRWQMVFHQGTLARDE